MSYILTFANTHAAIFAEKALLQAGYQVGVMPLPSGIKAGCGIALRVADHIGAKALLEENNIMVAAVYQALTNSQDTVYREVE
ncbi:Protein of unknown function (DUF3343) [Desulfosporosinus orientis DSM 765]|uniref:Putative Se/S carrier protein-like domain-containing protein n=1 Tax=Desulfosporosinus orientis (strain ATCC 19365 / DSM 765 / NCIMB 8382 / VKM B-1628 / Singapore I) TaxID=768706 RepID=G7WHV4_DESOD|nr:DUF3343 domain-containing protein [Desulfosporosinus orientis]AET69666.1 Protein of unknown function (DUF3343) [Desulfosporosinus orientis DSM 765]